MLLKTMFAAFAGVAVAGSLAAQEPASAPSTATPSAAALAVPPPLQPENTLHLDLSTGGRVTIQLRPDAAPSHVERIKTLTRQNFYNGLIFHRVIEGFMAQGGDPTGTGTGGSQLPDLTAEFNPLPHVRGAMSAARASDVNSANSQFFIMLAPRLTLDNKYTVMGRVVSGMEFVDRIERGEPPLNPSRILRASIGSDNLAPPTPGQIIPSATPAPAPAPAAPAPVTPPPPTDEAAPAEPTAPPTAPAAETPETPQ